MKAAFSFQLRAWELRVPVWATRSMLTTLTGELSAQGCQQRGLRPCGWPAARSVLSGELICICVVPWSCCSCQLSPQQPLRELRVPVPAPMCRHPSEE